MVEKVGKDDDSCMCVQHVKLFSSAFSKISTLHDDFLQSVRFQQLTNNLIVF